jgi:hypothetical protein
MSTIDIDFKSTTYFQHSSLTKVYGEPNYQSLQKMYQEEIKANATSVLVLTTSSLGGGLHGYLGLVVSPNPITRSTTQNTLTAWSLQPPSRNTKLQLVPKTSSTANSSATNKTFKECNLLVLEHTLIQQIKEAIHPDYLKAITDDNNTGLGTIAIIMAYLFENFGYVNPSTTALNDRQARRNPL